MASLFTRALFVGMTTVGLVAAGPASAQDDPEPPPSAPAPAPTAPTKGEWYGWQTLLVDTAALTVMLSGGGSGNAAFGWAGLGAYAIGPPVVHLTHDRPGIAAADLGLRVGAPFLLGAIGYWMDYSTNSCGNSDGLCLRGFGGLALGMLAGYVTAVAVDAAVFAREPVASPPPAARSARPLLQWSPTVAVERDGARAAIVGSF